MKEMPVMGLQLQFFGLWSEKRPKSSPKLKLNWLTFQWMSKHKQRRTQNKQPIYTLLKRTRIKSLTIHKEKLWLWLKHLAALNARKKRAWLIYSGTKRGRYIVLVVLMYRPNQHKPLFKHNLHTCTLLLMEKFSMLNFTCLISWSKKTS